MGISRYRYSIGTSLGDERGARKTFSGRDKTSYAISLRVVPGDQPWIRSGWEILHKVLPKHPGANKILSDSMSEGAE
jgi:hypothetical protein